jgi:hypothetical protein
MRFLARTLEECRRLDREGRTRRTFDEFAYRFAQEHLPAVAGLEHGSHVRIGEELQSRFLQLQTHPDRQRQTNDSADHGEDQVHCSNVSVMRTELAERATASLLPAALA